MSLNNELSAALQRTFAALCRLFRSLDLHIAELDLKLIDIRQTGLAQNRLLYVVFFCAAEHPFNLKTVMNHKWINNKCSKCGVERQKKEFKRWQRSETVLVSGVWQDRNIHTYGTAWHYGEQHKFERPDCVTDDSSMLFHECPNCNWRCNCNTKPCSCCND